MNKNFVRSALASLALIAIVAGAAVQPARADTAASTRLIVGAAAAAVILTELNVQHKNRVANTVVGYLPDGSTVYQDGHVVAAGTGQSWYPGNYGQTVACSNNQCYLTGASNNGYGYNNNGYGYNNNGYGYNNNGNSNNGGYYYGDTQSRRQDP